MRQTGFFVILGHFLPFYTTPPNDHLPPHANDPKNQNFEEKKNEENAWSYYPFIHTCTINEDMIYGF